MLVRLINNGKAGQVQLAALNGSVLASIAPDRASVWNGGDVSLTLVGADQTIQVTITNQDAAGDIQVVMDNPENPIAGRKRALPKDGNPKRSWDANGTVLTPGQSMTHGLWPGWDLIVRAKG